MWRQKILVPPHTSFFKTGFEQTSLLKLVLADLLWQDKLVRARGGGRGPAELANSRGDPPPEIESVQLN